MTISSGAAAQSTVPEIEARLRGQAVFLRGFWGNDHLHFDLTGKPEGRSETVSFTVCGFDFASVKMKKDGLEIRGHRMGIQFGPKGQPKRVALRGDGYEGDVEIRIDGQGGSDFGPALDAIFAPDLVSLAPSLPTAWSIVGERMAKQGGDAGIRAAASAVPAVSGRSLSGTPSAETGAVQHIAKGTKPPVLLKQVDPVFSVPARLLGYSGSVEVYLWVDETGKPSHLRIIRPAGLGLDEQALAAVSHYTFAPARQNGLPVKVDLYVDVNFQSF